MRFSRFPQGDFLLMRVLIGRNLGLLAWQLYINVRCSPAVLLLYPCCYQKEGESGHFQPVLATSLWRVECLHACDRFKKDSSLYLTGTLWPKHSINQHGKEGSKEGRSWGPSASQESDYYLGKRGYAVPRSCWHASSNLHLLITTFSYTTLWMQPSGLSHLRLFPTETGVRYFVKSFVLCAEGHRHPRHGWIAAIRKKDLTFVSPPEKSWKIV